MGTFTGKKINVLRPANRSGDHFGPCEECGKPMVEAHVYEKVSVYRRDNGELYPSRGGGIYGHAACFQKYGPFDNEAEELAQKVTPMTKYLNGYWGHIFEGEEHERMTRIVIDADAQKLVFAQIQRIRSMDSSYKEAERAEMADLQDSLLNGNSELFDDPAGHGLTVTEGLPDWAANLV